MHVRSVVAVGAVVSRSPAAHVLHCVQNACPAIGWNLLALHAKQVGALLLCEYVPAAHSSQTRSAVTLGGESSYSPGMQRVALSKENFWLSTQKKPPGGHASHCPVVPLP